MADTPHNPDHADHSDLPHEPAADFAPGQSPEVPIEEDELEQEHHPRRAASAEFLVQSEVGSDVAMREAMNPANKSLTDALRLSYRVLQLVLVVLVILFLASGSRTVGENESGVLTRWGRIMEVDGQESLQPGLHFDWPYPVGEFIVFDVQNLTVDLGNRFFFRMRPGETIEQAQQRANLNDPLTPGSDGSLITRDGDLAHLRMSAKYEIVDPAAFVRLLPAENDAAVNEIVRLALERATVHVASQSTLQQIIDATDDVKYEIQQEAQRFLDDLGAGLSIVSVNVPMSAPPLAIRKTYTELQNARVAAEERIGQAWTRAREVLIRAAGSEWAALIAMMDEYENAVALGESDRADELLAQLNARFDSDIMTGDAASLISQARNYRALLQSTLGNDARRFASLLPAYRNHPQLVVSELWMEAYRAALSRPNAELFLVPQGDSLVRFQINGRQDVARDRRDARLQQGAQDADRSGFDPTLSGILRASDMTPEGQAGRQLELGPDGRPRSLVDDDD